MRESIDTRSYKKVGATRPECAVRQAMRTMVLSPSNKVAKLCAGLSLSKLARKFERLNPWTIPGAVPVALRVIPLSFNNPPSPGRDIIIFCNCPNEAGAAQAARLLMEHGYARVRPLQGGLDAWIAAGHDMQTLSAFAANGRSQYSP